MNKRDYKQNKITQIVYSVSYLIPFLVCVSGSLFLYFNRKFVFGYTPIAGILIAIVIVLISGFLVWFTISILQNKKKIRRKRVLQILHGSLTVIGMFIIVFGFLSANLFISAIRYNTGPILTWATDQDPRFEITVMYRTRNPEASTISYGTDPNDPNFTQGIGFTREWHRISISNLESDTKYYYKVGKSPRAPTYHFTTAPSIEEDFTFVLFSDPRQNTSPINVLFKRNVPKFMVKTMEKEDNEIAFTINCGDITHDALNEATWKSWFDDISEKSGLASYAPLQIAAGNHERQENWTGDIFEEYYPYTNHHPGFYYSYNYSSLHVQVLDPINESSGWWGEFDPVQLAWAEQDLQNSISMKYKIIALHPVPVYNNTVNPELLAYQQIIDLCQAYDVDAVFYGHAHSYDVSYINGTFYYLIGVGGNSSSNPPGFAQVDVTSASMQVYMHWTNGSKHLIGDISA